MAEETILRMRKFVAPEIVFGEGAIELAGRYAKNMGVRKVLLVSDPGVLAAGWPQTALETLDQEGVSSSLFSQISPNPRAEECMAGAEQYKAQGCDAILAVGGGSPMDCAKGIGIVAVSGGHILDYEGIDKITAPGPPLIFAPTTSGTSADVSQFAIITDSKRKTKIAIVSKTVVPDVALIDPQTTTTMPLHLTACTAMDAFSHAVESYVSTAHSPLTDLHALEAVRLLNKNLPAVMKNPKDLELRGKIMLASLFAGLAFSNAILGAVHAMAHSLGGFLDLPHGECNALLLEHVVGYNFSNAAGRYRKIAQAMNLPVAKLTDGQVLGVLQEGIKRLRQEAGITGTLGSLGVTEEDIPLLASKALCDACLLTNPRDLEQQDIERLYQRAL